jgi:hypothetical protein
MKEHTMEFSGRCYCGNLQYRATGEPAMSLQCHCRECQYFSGGGANVTMAMPAAGFHYTRGTPKQFARQDLAHPVTREFCADCGTHILGRAPHAVPDVVFVKVGTMDEPARFKPELAIFTVDRQPFHHIPDGMPAFERTPG